MKTMPKDLIHDLDAPWIYDYIEADERKVIAAHDAIRWLVRQGQENGPNDHRTGCLTSILQTVADVLINERGWTRRQAADALVMEGVRAGGVVDRKMAVKP